MRHMEVSASEPATQSTTSQAEQDRLTRLRLCNEWNLVRSDEAESFAQHYRENIQGLVSALPLGREMAPEGRDLEALPERWDLCSEWNLVPAERMRLDNFIFEMALLEIRRRVKAHKGRTRR